MSVTFTCTSNEEAETIGNAVNLYGRCVLREQRGVDLRNYAPAIPGVAAGFGWDAVRDAARQMHEGSVTPMSDRMAEAIRLALRYRAYSGRYERVGIATVLEERMSACIREAWRQAESRGEYMCEVYRSKAEGHCSTRGVVVAHREHKGERISLVMCAGHALQHFTHWERTPVGEYIRGHGRTPAIHVKGRAFPDPDIPVKRTGYMAAPPVWGDEYGARYAAPVPALDVRAGDLYVFTNGHGNAHEVKTIEEIPMPDGSTWMRFGCNRGVQAGAGRHRVVTVLRPTPF